MTEKTALYSSLSESELMARYQDGDLEAFDRLYARYKSRVYGYLIKRIANPSDVDELFQDVFMRVHRSRFLYKREFPFKSWLFTILRNSLVDYYRKTKKNYRVVPMDELEAIPPELQVTETVKTDKTLLSDDTPLSENQKKAVELRYGNDFSFEEIARHLNTTPINARQIVSRALKKLRTTFKSKGRIR